MNNPPVFFHVDLDAFYASVEQLDDPGLKGRPVVVGARPGGRGVVSACSYEARAFGVHSAMPISEAVRRCPGAVFLPVRMKRYAEVSRIVMGVFRDFSPHVRPISIDEASLDMTGTTRLFGPPREAAALLKRRVRETAGVTSSVGIAANRFLAKMASDFRKPDGLYEVAAGAGESFVDAVGLAKLWGVGSKTLARLRELRLDSTEKIRALGETSLQSLMGQAGGAFLYRAVRGIDPGLYADTVKSHSISAETTFGSDTRDLELVRLVLLDLAHSVMFRLFDEGGSSRTVAVKYRHADFSTFSCRTTLGHPVCSAEELHRAGMELLTAKWDRGEALRLVGIGFEDVRGDDEPFQPELFQSEFDRKGIVEKTVFSLRKKNPRGAPVKASLLGKKGRSGESD